MTGRYTWDTELFYKGYFVPYSKQGSDSDHSEITKCMTLRPNIKVEPTSSKSKLSYVLLILFFLFVLPFYFILHTQSLKLKINIASLVLIYIYFVSTNIEIQRQNHVIEQVIFTKIKIEYLFGPKIVITNNLIC